MPSPSPRVTQVREIPPDPSIAQAVGRHHTFETAIADLVDNSIDVDASHVRVRFLQSRGAVVGLQVIDDGTGMDTAQIDAAMTFAKKRAYGDGDLGHFGLGLKAASLSQTDRLRVYSRRYGATAAGRTIDADTPTHVGELDRDDVDGFLRGIRVDFPFANGTVIEWDRPRTFLSSTDETDRAQWVERRITSLIGHLGVVFHRLLASERVHIAVDVFDTDIAESGVPRSVRPVDPFGYSALPNDRFPAPMRFVVDGVTTTGTAHVWPGSQSGLPEFRLGGKPGSLGQGFYFYRNDRLLQIGGWNTLTVDRAELEYVRIAIDLDATLSAHVTINPEKAGLELDADLRQALLAASIGTEDETFAAFLSSAETRRQDDRRYVKRPIELVEPGRGMSGAMRDAFAESVERVDAGPVDIRWRVDSSEAPLRVDLEARTIWLNAAYRDLIAGADAGTNDDAPLVKTLLVMLYSKYFEGSYLGSREKSELAAWEQLLTAAMRDELARREKEMRDERDR